jgi:hypothetical protein
VFPVRCELNLYILIRIISVFGIYSAEEGTVLKGAIAVRQ